MDTSYSLLTQSGTVTSYLPLTTTYVAPRNCFSTFFVHGLFPSQPAFAFDPNLNLFDIDSQLQCLPPPAVTWWEQNPTVDSTSIAIGPVICPAAYTTATTLVVDLHSQTTLVGCCPSGYYFYGLSGGGYPKQCISDLSAGQIISYYFNPTDVSSGAQSGWSLTTGSVSTKTTIAGVQINGYIISATSTTSPSSAPAITAPSPTITIFLSQSASTLSTGGAVGITVGAFSFLAGCMILIYVYFRRRRKAKQTILPAGPRFRSEEPPKETQYLRQESGAYIARSELPGVARRHELSG